MGENKKGATITVQTIDIKIKNYQIQLNDGANKNNQINLSYFPKPNFNNKMFSPYSMVDALKSVGYDSSKEFRLKIGKRNNIPGVPLSPQYNSTMLNLMKEGKLIIP